MTSLSSQKTLRIIYVTCNWYWTSYGSINYTRSWKSASSSNTRSHSWVTRYLLVVLEWILPRLLQVANYPAPTTVKQLQSFLGLTNFCRRFIKDYASITKPLTLLTRTTIPFLWTQDHDRAFQALKTALTTAPVLRIFDPDL